MKTVIVKVNDASQTIEEYKVVTQSEPLVLQAQQNVNYEIFDTVIGRAPNHIVTKRISDDLHISLEANGDNDNIIIQGFYNDEDNALIGVAEDNNYYYYIPDTGEVVNYVTELDSFSVEGHALGGKSQSHAMWVDSALVHGHTQTDTIAYNSVPWVVGLLGVASVAALIDRRDKDDEHEILSDSTIDVSNESSMKSTHNLETHAATTYGNTNENVNANVTANIAPNLEPYSIIDASANLPDDLSSQSVKLNDEVIQTSAQNFWETLFNSDNGLMATDALSNINELNELHELNELNDINAIYQQGKDDLEMSLGEEALEFIDTLNANGNEGYISDWFDTNEAVIVETLHNLESFQGLDSFQNLENLEKHDELDMRSSNIGLNEITDVSESIEYLLNSILTASDEVQDFALVLNFPILEVSSFGNPLLDAVTLDASPQQLLGYLDPIINQGFEFFTIDNVPFIG